MRSMIWRAVYAAVCYVIFIFLVPLFLDVIGFPATGSLWMLIKASAACLALLYVLFGSEPRTPF